MFSSLKTCLQLLLTLIRVFYRKKTFTFTYCNIIKLLQPLPFKQPIFPEMLVSKKNADTFFLETSVVLVSLLLTLNILLTLF